MEYPVYQTINSVQTEMMQYWLSSDLRKCTDTCTLANDITNAVKVLSSCEFACRAP